MSHALDGIERHRGRRITVSSLGLLALAVLAPLSVVLVTWAIPSMFEIEWACVGTGGVGSRSGDKYAGVVAVLGVFGWIVVFAAVLFAHIADRPRLGALLPVVWFLALVGGSALAAAAIGPAPCPL